MKIVSCVLTAFLFSFFILIYFQITHPDSLLEKQDKFYTQGIQTQKEKIFLLGASHVGQLNTTRINESISQNHENYLVYNLAYNGDNPKKRFTNIEKTISLKPKMVFYGISYRDFESQTSENAQLPKPNDLLNDIFKLDTDSIQINPKFTTLQAIRSISNNDEFFKSRHEITIPNTPFFVYNDEQITITPNSSIDGMSGTTEGAGLYVAEPAKNIQLLYLKKILRTLSENNIKVVFFTTPLHQTYLNDMSYISKNNFELILDDIKNNYDVKLYNYTSTYSHLNIWANPDHVAYNKMSMIYSDDIAEMIQDEIDS